MNSSLLRLLPNETSDNSHAMPVHNVARCLWDTTLDEQSLSHHLQEHLSQWSKTELTLLLEQAFELYCPVGYLWRIDCLELNLGEIAFNELQTELPKRLETCLHEQLRQLLQSISWQTVSSVTPYERLNKLQNNMQILSRTGSFNDFINYFLHNGTNPWWYNHKEGHTQILLQQLWDTPEQVADIIRHAGKTEAVRRRIAWQYQPTVIKKIIGVLEPYHHEYIVAFADNLQDIQLKTQELKRDRGQFERRSWFWILTHLLVERGSLFNTMTFVESTLMQMAHSYQIDYHLLLQQLIAAAQSLNVKGNNSSPSFIRALLGVQQKTFAKNEARDSWQLLTDNLRNQQQAINHNDVRPPHHSLDDFIEYFLRNGTIPWWYNRKERHTQILLQQLQNAPEEIAKIIRRVGKTETVRKRIASQYQSTIIKKIIAVLEPSHHEYIVAFANNLQNLQAKTQKLQSDSELFKHQSWFWILTHLLVERGSLFNTIAFVESTLMQMAHSYRIDYHILLQQLVTAAQSVSAKGNNPPQFIRALLDIQQRGLSKNGVIEMIKPNNLSNPLKQQSLTFDEQAQNIDDIYCQALAIYLSTGQAPKVISKHHLPFIEQIFSTLLYNQSHLLVLILTGVKARTDINRSALPFRLLALIQSADFPLVLNILNARVASLANTLIALILRWQNHHGLPSLKGFDIYYELHSVVLGMLIDELKSNFTVAVFMRAFFAGLSNRGINSHALSTEMILCLLLDDAQNIQTSPEQQIMLQWLKRAKARYFSTMQNRVLQLGVDVSIAQKIASLLTILRENTLGLKRVKSTKNYSKTTLSSLFTAIKSHHTNLLLEQLQRQTDCKVLVLTLLEQDEAPKVQQWLNSLWSTDEKSALTFLSEWQNTMAQSGLWRGSTKVLKQKLHDIFWLSLLNRTLTVHRTLNQADMNALLTDIVLLSCTELHIKLAQLNQSRILDHAPLWQAALLHLNQTENKRLTVAAATSYSIDEHNIEFNQKSGLFFEQDNDRHYLSHPLLSKLCEHLLLHGRTPLWLQTSRPLNLQQMLADLLHDNPQELNEILKRIQHEPRVLFRLYHLLSFENLQTAIMQTNPELKPLLLMLAAVYQSLSRLHFSGVHINLLPTIMWQKILSAWLNGDWQHLSAPRIFFELSAELMRRYALTPEIIAAEFKRNAQYFPKECRMILENEQTQIHQAIAISKSNIKKPITPKKELTTKPTKQTMPIQISNAGLVILQGFISTYFNRLGLTDDSVFCSPQFQRNAVHCLQYLVTGLSVTEEPHLVLNKLLCGLEIYEPIELSFNFTDDDKMTADSLIEAVINYWSSIGSSSIDGFRGNWLVRNGLLSRNEDCWDLIVEKRPYDLLLQSSPFSFQLIKLPWMTDPLYVTWQT